MILACCVACHGVLCCDGVPCVCACSNVRSNPEVAKYRHIRLSNKAFQSKLWRHEAARTILRQLGWTEEGDSVSMAEYKEGDFDIVLASLQEYIK